MVVLFVLVFKCSNPRQCTFCIDGFRIFRKDAMDAVKGGSKGGGGGRGGDRIRSSSKERRQRGSRESLTDSVHLEGDENPGIKTKIFHALGLNS